MTPAERRKFLAWLRISNIMTAIHQGIAVPCEMIDAAITELGDALSGAERRAS